MPAAFYPQHPARCFVLCLVGALGMGWCNTARAQNLDIQLGRMAPGDTGLTMVQGAEAGAPGHWVVGAELTYMYQPLRLYSTDNKQSAAVVNDHLGLVPTASYVVLPDLEVFGSWQVVPFETIRLAYDGKAFVPKSSVTAGVGDVWLGGKYTLLHAERFLINLAGALDVRVPVFSSHYLSDGGFAAVPRLLASWRWKWLLLAGDLGFILRKPVMVNSLTLGEQLRWRAGAGVNLEPLHVPQVDVNLEVFGLSDVPHQRLVGQVPVEFYLGARYRYGDFLFSAGGGRGFTNAYGSPLTRLLIAATWSPLPPPPPPATPVVVPTDVDHDGILDANDACPDEAEDYLAPEPSDGCRKEPDRDNDGLADEDDACPDEAGDPNTDGCPPKPDVIDTDGDGIADPNDKCPHDPEDKPGPDADGCPETDQDKDGIPDDKDQCPEKAEVINGIADEDGCPDDGAPPLVEMKNETIELKGTVFFGVGKDDLLRRAYRVLDQLASLLRNHRHMHIRVEGYSDASGGARVNMRLSKRRAESVRRYLINKGIDSDRIETAAMGESAKYGSNQQARGRALNRRVTIAVIKAKPAP